MNIKSYEKENKKLFTRWEKIADDVPFAADGVVNPAVWFAEKVRPLFLFDEAFGADSDLARKSNHTLTDDSNRRIWQRISLWTKGILKTGATYMEPFDPWCHDIVYSDNKYLNRIAAVNIKKDSGKIKAGYNEICEYAKAGKDLLKEQIELCDPTVIICGGTAGILEIILDNEFRKKHNNNLFYTVYINGHPVTVIDYWKPSNAYPEIMNYYCLTEIYQRAVRSGYREKIGA